MDQLTVTRFDTRSSVASAFLDVIARTKGKLVMFDPDFSVFPLGSIETDAALRHLLSLGAQVQMAMHDTAHIERNYPRFMRLLRDYSHRIECRVTNRQLRTLTDSFVIGDHVHIARRFHSDHMRGEAAFNAPLSTEVSNERFVGIWAESLPGLHATTTGL